MPDNVIGDEKRVLEILLHTVGNAIKSTKKRTISVHVGVVDKSAGRWDHNNPTWRPSLCEGYIYLRFKLKSSNSVANGIDIPSPQKILVRTQAIPQYIMKPTLDLLSAENMCSLCMVNAQVVFMRATDMKLQNIWQSPSPEDKTFQIPGTQEFYFFCLKD
jgi:hypothetical protein